MPVGSCFAGCSSFLPAPCRGDQPCAKPATAWERWHQRLVPEIAEEILPPRRNRINPRVIKQKMRKWPKKRFHHRRPPQPKPFEDSIVLCH
jgi:hypothetical protein